MLESDKFFDSLQGKLLGVLLGTLAFGAVVPTLLNYLQSILYYQPGEHPVWDFWLVSGLYFLLPVVCLLLGWALVVKVDHTPYVPPIANAEPAEVGGKTSDAPPRWEQWLRWLPVGGLAGLAAVFACLFYDLSSLPGRWLYYLCLLLLLLPGPLLLLLWWSINRWLGSLPWRAAPAGPDAPEAPATPGPRLWQPPAKLTWRQVVSVVGVPGLATLGSLLLLGMTFTKAGEQLHKDALRYAHPSPLAPDTSSYAIAGVRRPRADLLDASLTSPLWLTYHKQPLPDSAQAPFRARHNYEACQRLSKSQENLVRLWKLRASPSAASQAGKAQRAQALLGAQQEIEALVLNADSVRQLRQPWLVGQYLQQVAQCAGQLAPTAPQLAPEHQQTHQALADVLGQEATFLERQAQEYYSLLLGQLQVKGRLWLLLLLNLLLWGWAALRLADEGYLQVWNAAQPPTPPPYQVAVPASGASVVLLSPAPPADAPTLPFTQEQALLQQFVFITFGLLVPLLNPVRPESIALDKPLWSLTLPSFVRTVVQQHDRAGTAPTLNIGPATNNFGPTTTISAPIDSSKTSIPQAPPYPDLKGLEGRLDQRLKEVSQRLYEVEKEVKALDPAEPLKVKSRKNN